MLYANTNGLKCSATPKARGTCPYCQSEVRARCGTRYIWHWAHVSKADCDKWWEGETEWHREWKACFPIECQEVIHRDPNTNEKHIADVKTLNGTVIEFQNSSLTFDELRSRETFYGKMFWVVNGAPFKDNFWFGPKLPSPKAEMIKNLQISASNSKPRYSALLLSPNASRSGSLREAYQEGESLVQQAIEQKYDGHQLFQWLRPRATWYLAQRPVIFDFGEQGLFRMMRYPKCDFFVVKRIEKEELLLKNGGTLPCDAAAQQMRAT